MSLGPFEELAADLAPGDRHVLEADWSAFELRAIESAADPLFAQAYDRLWHEFGERGEMEQREVLAGRLEWRGRSGVDGRTMLYEMTTIRRDGRIVALRDHTAVTTGSGAIVVHLSHVLVEPELRGSGLAGWLRALPLRTARSCARSAGLASPAITLVSEMEHDDGSPAARRRLRSYAKAGFRMVDPREVDYEQPDFRSAAEIDASSVEPVPLMLCVRRVGREAAGEMPRRELRELVDALYAVFGAHLRADHMSVVRAHAEAFQAGDEPVALLLAAELHAGRAQEAAP